MKINITSFPDKAIKFLKEVKGELKRVTWPTKQETTKHTLTVIGLSLALAVFLGGLDFLFSWLINSFVL